jgi:hypothetical protein
MLNKQQTEYALKKAENVYRGRVMALSDQYVKPEVKLSPREKLEALSKGVFTFDLEVDHTWHYWYNGIKFNAETPQEVDPRFVTEKARLERDYGELKDTIVLGDGDEAMKLLKAFADFAKGWE